jgi:hypothetical protein
MGVRWTLCGFGKKRIRRGTRRGTWERGDILYCVIVGSLGLEMTLEWRRCV